MANKRFYRDSRKEIINKAWHLLNVFDYDWIKKKDLVPLESGCNASGRLDYILITDKQHLFEYKFRHDAFTGWSMNSYLVEKEDRAIL